MFAFASRFRISSEVFRTRQNLNLIDDFYLCDVGTRVLDSHVANYLFQ